MLKGIFIDRLGLYEDVKIFRERNEYYGVLLIDGSQYRMQEHDGDDHDEDGDDHDEDHHGGSDDDGNGYAENDHDKDHLNKDDEDNAINGRHDQLTVRCGLLRSNASILGLLVSPIFLILGYLSKPLD